MEPSDNIGPEAIATSHNSGNTGNYQNHKLGLRTLKSQLKKLKRLEVKLEERLSGNEVLGNNLLKWWEEAGKFLREVEESNFDDQINRRRFVWRCISNCSAQHSNGKQILELTRRAKVLLHEFEKQSFSSVSLPVRGSIRPSAQLIGVQATELLELIWYFLKKPNINTIGIHGEAGVGKTSILTQIHNRAVEEKLNSNTTCFDYVFWVDAGRESNTIQSLQQSIRAEVNITKKVELSNALMKKGNYLLIVDGISEAFSLEDIGIPAPTKENGSKLIITSRSVNVCESMKTDKDFEVQLLSDNDAWALFADVAGRDFISKSWESRTIAQQVAKECRHLPLVITTVASSLRKVTDRFCWEETLNFMKKSATNAAVMNNILKISTFSYKRLGNNTSDCITQTCFLYCALYPKGYNIDAKELIEFWMWEGFFSNEGKEEKIEDQMKKGQTILKELKDVGLIECSHQEDGVQHVLVDHLIRDMAVCIIEDMAVHSTEATPRFLIRTGIKEREFSYDWPQNVERVSLMRNDFKGFPNKPKCPSLSTLLLQHNYSLTSLCDDFFTEMPLLKVLNLSHTGILSLPNLSKLKKLRALLVTSCWKLKRLPSLQEVQELRVLDLSYTSIRQLPHGMYQLINLRRLNLSYSKVANFRSKLLSCFKKLEELLMYGCDFFWGEACIDELKASQHLVILEVNFSNEHVFDTYVRTDHWYQLKSFKFCVGEIYDGTMGNYGVAITKSFLVNGSPVLLPDYTTDLHMVHCADIIDQLQIKDRLENLKVVDISACGNLKVLFKREVLSHLPNLQQITIKHCQSMEKIIEEEENSNKTGATFFPHLQTLTLIDLPKLKSIYEGVVVWEFLQTMEVVMCNNLKKIPLSPNDQNKVRGEEAWFTSLEWEPPSLQTLLELWSQKETAPVEPLSRNTAGTSSSSKTEDLTTTTAKDIVEGTMEGTAANIATEIMEGPGANIGKEITEDTAANIGKDIVEETGKDIIEGTGANIGMEIMEGPGASIGQRSGSSKVELEAPKGSHAMRPRPECQLSQEEGNLSRPTDSPLRPETVSRRATLDSTYRHHGGTSTGETPERAARQSASSDRSIDHSPLHPHNQARFGGKGSGVSSPSWERKGSSQGSHGLAPTTPGKSQLGSVTRADNKNDDSTAVPKFGDWDDRDPAAGEGFTQLFNQVREEKQSGAGKVPAMPRETSYHNVRKQYGNDNSKCRFCFPWGGKENHLSIN